MRFIETELKGAFVIEPELIRDERGYFARTWSAEDFAAHGLNHRVVQCSTAYNRHQGTIRGMHFQCEPHEEAKLVRCTRGAIYDVIVDLRSGSPTRYRWTAVELSEGFPRMFYIPEGFAHGYQTLADNTEVFYQISQHYCPGSGRGLRWDDPALDIKWPLPVSQVSSRDKEHPLMQTQSP
jgi:dTDP-4-dehydrorhamnose 3,5-epimerase